MAFYTHNILVVYVYKQRDGVIKHIFIMSKQTFITTGMNDLYVLCHSWWVRCVVWWLPKQIQYFRLYYDL